MVRKVIVPRRAGRATVASLAEGEAPDADAAELTPAAASLGAGASGNPPAAVVLDAAAAHREAARACSFDRWISYFGLVMHGSTQLASLLAWQSLSGAERFQRLLSIVHASALCLLTTLAPAWYMLYRSQVVVAYRLTFFAFPLLRKPAGIQRVMEAEPLPGVRGIAQDLLKVVWGSRLVAVFMSSMMTPLHMLPLVPHLLVQVYSVGMVRANSSLCSTLLLAHPVTARRIHGFHSVMQLLAMVLPGGIGQTLEPRLHAGRREQECEAFLSFLFPAVGLLLPIVLLIGTEPPSLVRAWERSGAGSGSAHGSTIDSSGRSGGGWAGVWSRLCRLCGAAAAAVEGGIRQLCGRSLLAPVGDAQAAVWLPGLQAPEPNLQLAGSVLGQPPKLAVVLRGWHRIVAWWLLLSLLWGIAFELHVQR